MAGINSYTRMNPLTDKSVERCGSPPNGKACMGKGTAIIDGRTVDVTVYRSKHGAGWKVGKGILAFLMSLGLLASSAGLLLLIPKVLETWTGLWKQAASGLGNRKWIVLPKASDHSPQPSIHHPNKIEAHLVKPQGVQNVGNSCYINAMLQMFMMYPSFIQHVENLEPSNCIQEKMKEFVLAWKEQNRDPAALGQIVNELRSEAYRNKDVLDLALADSETDQDDAFHFFLQILILLEFTCCHEVDRIYDKHQVFSLTRGERHYLQFTGSTSSTTLQDRINDEYSPEPFVWTNSQGQEINVMRKLTISHFPEYLVAELPEMTASEVPGDGLLDFSNAVEGNTEKVMYEIQGYVANRPGHSFYEGKFGGDWYTCNDSFVSKVTLGNRHIDKKENRVLGCLLKRVRS